MFGVCVKVVASTEPLVSVKVPEVCAGGTAQRRVLEQMSVTFAVVETTLPLTIALSCTVVPALTDVTTPCAASWMSVANEPGLTLPTVNPSQAPTLELYVESPLYVAWKANEPEVLGVCVNVVASTVPLVSVNVPEVC